MKDRRPIIYILSTAVILLLVNTAMRMYFGASYIEASSIHAVGVILYIIALCSMFTLIDLFNQFKK